MKVEYHVDADGQRIDPRAEGGGQDVSINLRRIVCESACGNICKLYPLHLRIMYTIICVYDALSPRRSV